MDNNWLLKEFRVHGRLKRNVTYLFHFFHLHVIYHIIVKKNNTELLRLQHILSKIII